MLRGLCVLCLAGIALRSLGAQAQLSTKVVGALGIDAGTVSAPGFYIVDRLVLYRARKAIDRNGDVIDIPGFDLVVRANNVGLAYTFRQPARLPRLTVAAAFPWARTSVNADEPVVSQDRLGLGDVSVQPIKIGWTNPRRDVVVGYSVFIPTGEYEPKRVANVGRGHWTEQAEIGGAIYAKENRARHASALLTYEHNGRKRGVNITRGDFVQIQGGAGAPIYQGVILGVAGFSQWQVTDDRGPDLPQRLAGIRTRAFGLGPEIDFVNPKRGLKAEFRFEWDFGVRSRTQGHVFAAMISYRAWTPSRAR